MWRLGIDVGASSCQFVLMNEDFEVVSKDSKMHKNKVRDCLRDFLREVENVTGDDSNVLISVCGMMKHLIGVDKKYYVSESLALCDAAGKYYPEARSYVVIGSQKTMYIVPEEGREPVITHNSNCSSGTGSFFEEQAGRLQIPLSDISATVDTAKSIPQIAGRCSVFSKTDIIHHMQEGVPAADLLLGLCYALVRNYRASILRNRPVKKPVLLCGGVMENTGVIKAIKDILSLSDEDFILDDNFKYLPAEGCALNAISTITLEELKEEIEKETDASAVSGLAPLKNFKYPEDDLRTNFTQYPFTGSNTYLGIDIGSTSINLVLIDEAKNVLYFSYVKNTGSPLQIVKAEIEKLKAQIPEGTSITSIAVTGSGREYVGNEIGAGLVINEITAQTEGSTLFNKTVDTIFEIGGQDSKYMSIKDGKMVDFEMNKVCAAGTGAFLEEQIRKLGVSMSEFQKLALQSEHPVELGDRCTVFIESSITKALAEGNSMADVCAGLAYAIVSNYLHRVVNLKPIGSSLALQGGVAYNEAVVCAFRSLTGKPVKVSPYFSVTGALGAASLCTNAHYLKFDKEHNQYLNKKLLEDTENAYLEGYVEPDGSKPVIGIPRVIFLHKMFPLFKTMFTKLGFDVLVSPKTNREIVSLAQKYAMEETCYPIKLINGHIGWLMQHNVQYIFLPRLYGVEHKGSIARKDLACMYMQTSPIMMEQTFHFAEKGVTLVTPELALSFGKKFMINSLLSMGTVLGKPKPLMIPAALAGMKSLVEYSDKLETLAPDYLDTDEPVFVLVSRVYNLIDPALNMGIEEHLNSLGCRIVHLENLEASTMNVDDEFSNLYWPFGQHILTSMKIIKAHKNLYPIYITNHGCGPDTAIQHYVKRELEGREYLHLEVDEHTSKVGVITRLEAFLYSLNTLQKDDGEDCSKCEADCDSREDGHVHDPAHHAGNGGHNHNHVHTHYERPEVVADTVLIPDYGIYSELMKDLVPEGSNVQMIKPLQNHRSFNYAINKEYYSMLVMLEEILDQTGSDHKYRLMLPTDEGSEVFGQYGRLFEHELTRLGRDTVLDDPFMEDFTARENYKELYLKMIALELDAMAADGKITEASEDAVFARAKSVEDILQNNQKAKVLAIGEPLCVFKDYIAEQNTELLDKKCVTLRMPLSELLLFHIIDTDRKKEKTSQTDWMVSIHDKIASILKTGSVFTQMDKLIKAPVGILDFCVGNGAKYRLAKLLTANPEACDGILNIYSEEENVSVILRVIIPSLRNSISVPVCSVGMDFEHALTEEDAETFLHYMSSNKEASEEDES